MAQMLTGSVRDIPGRLREYETVYILKPDVPDEGVAVVNQKVRGIIEADAGILLKVDNWGKRRLAYEVKKQLKGIYVFFNYLAKGGLVTELERNLKLTDAVIRYYTVKVNENVDPASRTSEVTDESFAKAATPAPDEEAIVLGHASSGGYEDYMGDDLNNLPIRNTRSSSEDR